MLLLCHVERRADLADVGDDGVGVAREVVPGDLPAVEPDAGHAHVSALFYDVLGASHAGMTGVWLDRGKVPWDDFAGDPDAVVSDIREVGPTLDVTQ